MRVTVEKNTVTGKIVLVIPAFADRFPEAAGPDGSPDDQDRSWVANVRISECRALEGLFAFGGGLDDARERLAREVLRVIERGQLPGIEVADLDGIRLHVTTRKTFRPETLTR